MKKILLIEDDSILRENTEIFLKLKKFDVITASDGKEGVELAIREQPDIIICDITMPVMNGYEVLTTLRQNASTSVIPFIFLTARAEKEDYRKGLQLGVDDYISKPFSFNELSSAIELRLSKAENLINSVTEQFMSLMELSDTGFFIYRLNRFEYANKKFLNQTGYSFEELVSIPVTEIIAEKDQESFITAIEQCTGDKKNRASSLDLELNTRDGHQIRYHLECALKVMTDERIIFAAREISGETGSLPPALLEQIRNIDPALLANISATGRKQHSRYEEKLSARETEILRLIADGLTTPEIGEKLFISPRTVEFHRANLLSKTCSKNLAELIKYAIHHQVI